MTTRTQPVSAAPGQRYGDRKAQEDAQRAAPMAGSAPPSAPSGGGAVQGAPPAQPNIFAPTERPNEPLTAGAELLPPDPVAHLRALYARFPNDDLRRLLERASER